MTFAGTHIAGTFEAERPHLEDQGSHIRAASVSGAARSQEVDQLRKPRARSTQGFKRAR